MKPVSYLGDVIAALLFSGRLSLLAFEFYHNKNASSSQPSPSLPAFEHRVFLRQCPSRTYLHGYVPGIPNLPGKAACVIFFGGG